MVAIGVWGNENSATSRYQDGEQWPRENFPHECGVLATAALPCDPAQGVSWAVFSATLSAPARAG